MPNPLSPEKRQAFAERDAQICKMVREFNLPVEQVALTHKLTKTRILQILAKNPAKPLERPA